MNASTPVDKSSALWIEWLKFKNSEEYANVLRWPDNIEGNLWCAFESGFRSAASGSTGGAPTRDELAKWICTAMCGEPAKDTVGTCKKSNRYADSVLAQWAASRVSSESPDTGRKP